MWFTSLECIKKSGENGKPVEEKKSHKGQAKVSAKATKQNLVTENCLSWTNALL